MRYHERRIAPVDDPLRTGVRLAREAGFDQYVLYEADGCWSFGGGSLLGITVDDHGARRSDQPPPAQQPPGDPFEQVADILLAAPVEDWRAYGWIAFECGEGGAGRPVDAEPLLRLTVPSVEVRLDRSETLVRAVDPDDLDRITRLVGPREPTPPADSPSADGPRTDGPRADVPTGGGSRYRDAVTAAIDEIAVSALQKVVISRRVAVPADIDLGATYEAGRRANTPARSFLLHLGGLGAAGFSPETVLRTDGRTATAHILAGTRPTGADEAETLRLGRNLLQDPKEIYEHAISVAAARDDLAGVCLPDSVVVEDFMTVRRRGSVQHLASTLTGRLAATGWHALAAVLPASAATGVPRPLAREAIRRIERAPRGLYGGAVLTCDANGALDAAIALRTVFSRGGTTWLQVGAGITSQSDPDREYQETCHKLASLTPHLVPAADRVRVRPETPTGKSR